MDDLSNQQQAFVDELIASGCTPTEAARRAGYKHPSGDAYRLMRKEKIISAIRFTRARMVEGELTTLALNQLRDTMIDPESPAGLKLKAAAIVLKLARIGEPEASQQEHGGRTLAGLTLEELRALSAELRAPPTVLALPPPTPVHPEFFAFGDTARPLHAR